VVQCKTKLLKKSRVVLFSCLINIFTNLIIFIILNYSVNIKNIIFIYFKVKIILKNNIYYASKYYFTFQNNFKLECIKINFLIIIFYF